MENSTTLQYPGSLRSCEWLKGEPPRKLFNGIISNNCLNEAKWRFVNILPVRSPATCNIQTRCHSHHSIGAQFLHAGKFRQEVTSDLICLLLLRQKLGWETIILLPLMFLFPADALKYFLTMKECIQSWPQIRVTWNRHLLRLNAFILIKPWLISNYWK